VVAVNPAGVVLAIAGIWIVSQVFAGNALERLGILKPTPTDQGGGIIPDIGSGLAPYVPGGPKNPVAPTFPDIFGNAYGPIGGGKYL
jgi:hypothetical protein